MCSFKCSTQDWSHECKAWQSNRGDASLQWPICSYSSRSLGSWKLQGDADNVWLWEKFDSTCVGKSIYDCISDIDTKILVRYS